MQILVLPFFDARGNRDSIIKNFPVIAFRDSQNSLEDLFGNTDRSLTLIVDDIDEPQMSGGKDLVLFTEDHARLVIDFIKKHKDSDSFVVHCVGGKCRSGAVGFFLNEKMNCGNPTDQLYFETNNSQIIPNNHILSVLNKVWLMDLHSELGCI